MVSKIKRLDPATTTMKQSICVATPDVKIRLEKKRGWKMLFSFFNKKNEKFAPGAEKQLFYFYSFVEMLLIFSPFFSPNNCWAGVSCIFRPPGRLSGFFSPNFLSLTLAMD
jgi:hypothetical protein